MNTSAPAVPACRRRFRRVLSVVLAGAAVFLLANALPAARAADDDENALEQQFADVLAPDTKQGFMLRQDTWNGNLPQGETKPIAHQFFKGNEYHLYVRTDVKGAKVSIHIYDGDGNLAESRSWERESVSGSFSGAEIMPKYTGRYYLIVKVEQSTAAKHRVVDGVRLQVSGEKPARHRTGGGSRGPSVRAVKRMLRGLRLRS